MSKKKNVNWTRGKNITVSDEAHAKFLAHAYVYRKTLRQLLEEIAEEMEMPDTRSTAHK